MTREELTQVINAGFTPATFFKRGAWTKIERVMNYLANVGLVIRTPHSDVKFALPNGEAVTKDIVDMMTDRYLNSPFAEHYNELAILSAQTGIPMNDKELLNRFMNLNLA